MSDEDHLPLDLHLERWVDAARHNPTTYRNRQVTRMLLTAIGLTPDLRDNMLLKGGALMMLGFGSPRGTADIDFTVVTDPEPFASNLAGRLNPALLRASASLGYVDLVARVQTAKRRPRTETFEDAIGPALTLTIAHARRGTPEERRLLEGQSTQVLQVDLSFKEPVFSVTDATLEDTSIVIRSYSLTELMAEKIRALLQQTIRNRMRRQDVFDIAWLCRNAEIDEKDKAEILHTMIKKAEAREIHPDINSMDNDDIRNRAKQTWHTLEQELDIPLPDFDQSFETVRGFYRSLPWP